MADKTGISWTDATWNPIVGCSLVSPGCTNCYAMKQAARIVAMNPKSHYKGTVREVNGNAVWTGTVNQAPDATWEAPLRWKKPRRIFVNSMGDLFHESVPEAWIDRAFAVMALTPQHTFQVLTKRAKRMRQYITRTTAARRIYELACDLVTEEDIADVVLIAPFVDPNFAPPGRKVFLDVWPLPNVWLGVSAEDQARADERIPDLLATPAALRFVSAEPLLAPIEINQWLQPACARCPPWETPCRINCEHVTRLDWIIAGGESGPGYRGLDLAAAYNIQDQCKAARAAFWFKQDSGPRAGMRGRASQELWTAKDFPMARADE